MARALFALSGIFGFFGVGLGAFGAHALTSRLSALPDAAVRLDWWRTAAQYHLVHALAIGVCAVLVETRQGRAASLAGAAFAVGILLFSGSLYAMTLTGIRALGAVTPLGGLAFLAGWLALAVAGLRG